MSDVYVVYDDLKKLQEPLIVGSPAICPVCGNHMVSHHKSLECEGCSQVWNVFSKSNRLGILMMGGTSDLECEGCSQVWLGILTYRK